MFNGQIQLDSFGLLCVGALTFYTLFPYLSSLIMLLGHWDPLYLSLSSVFISSTKFPEGEVLIQTLNLFFKLLGFLNTFAATQCVSVVMRNFVLLTVGMGGSFINLLFQLTLAPLTRHTLVMYKSMDVAFAIVKPLAEKISTFFLAIAMTVFVIGCMALLHAYEIEDHLLSNYSLTVTCCFILVVDFVCNAGAFLHVNSTEILSKWGMSVRGKWRKEGVFLSKCVRACRKVTLRVNSLERIINREMKLQYLNSALNNVATCAVVINGIQFNS